MTPKIVYLDGLTELNCKCTTENIENFTGYSYVAGTDGKHETIVRGHSITSVVKYAASHLTVITDAGRIG